MLVIFIVSILQFIWSFSVSHPPPLALIAKSTEYGCHEFNTRVYKMLSCSNGTRKFKYHNDIEIPSKLLVRLKGDAKYAQSTREGAYILTSNLMNGKSYWIQNSKRNAIWYNIDFGVWNIGLLKNLGSIKSGIVSLDSTNNTSPIEATTWAYVKNGKWITAPASSVMVEEDFNIPFRRTSNPRKRSSTRITFPSSCSDPRGCAPTSTATSTTTSTTSTATNTPTISLPNACSDPRGCVTTTTTTTTYSGETISSTTTKNLYNDQKYLLESSRDCRSSKTDAGYKNKGALNTSCVFPFTVQGTTYYACTYDFNFITGHKPWCSTKTDENGKHISGNWGICDDKENCNIPPRLCGEPVEQNELVDEYDYNDDVTIKQLPWMVSLGEFTSPQTKWKHHCGGSIITKRHVLTAAHCMTNSVLESIEDGTYFMRMGTSELSNAQSGTRRKVLKAFKHPKYKSVPYFDAAIYQSDIDIEFTKWVMPICLPMRPLDDDDAFADQYVTLAGWGLNFNQETAVYEQTDALKVMSLSVNAKDDCEKMFTPEALEELGFQIGLVERGRLKEKLRYGFSNEIACVGHPFDISQGSCDGDSGGPVVKRIVGSARNRPYYEQQFIVSDGFKCEAQSTIFTRVSNRQILSWIQKITDTSPLLMVVGGFNDKDLNKVNGLLRSVELITPTGNRFCNTARSMKWLSGRQFTAKSERVGVQNTTIYEFEAYGMTGQFVQEAPIVCGGKNDIIGYGNINKCLEYQIEKNEWKEIATMKQPRYRASSTLDNDGFLWVLGGTHDNSSTLLSTEVYFSDQKRWRDGYPLPPALRDTGIDSQCTVRINSTHTFMTGGYAGIYSLCDTSKNVEILKNVIPGDENVRPSICDDLNVAPDAPELFGALVLNRAWMYNDGAWYELPSMSTTRDRPHCSLVEEKNGLIKILVAGGCKEWCEETNVPLKSAEIYDPQTNTWTKAADMPEPLSSAKMELFDGLPTTVGGTNGITQISTLYQYNITLDQWFPHPKAKLKISRSSAAVFQVPRLHFRNC